MKLILLPGLLILSVTAGFTQSTSCSNQKIVSPVVAAPANPSLESTTCSTMVVKWTGHANQVYVIQGFFKDAVTLHSDTTQGTNIICDGSFNCSATIPVIPGKQVTWCVEAQEIINGITYTSYALRSKLDYPIAACGPVVNPLKFSGKVFLQGAYNTSTGNMNNALNSLGILQTFAAAQPYNNAVFNYAGTESVGSGFFGAHTDIVDWVLLELRNPNLPATIIARRAAFVKQDGTLAETDGTDSQVAFPGIAPGYYYVTILHRNHLTIRTNAALDFSGGASDYNYAANGNQAFKNQPYTSTVLMGGNWAMRGGNANGNGNVKYNGPGNDQNQVLNVKLGGSLTLVLNNVYAPEDLNMNGNVKWNGPGNDQNFLLNIVLGGSLSNVRNKQL